MTGGPDPAVGIDPVGTAGGLGAIAGIASLAWPFFDGMAAALVALAVVGWAARGFPGRPRGRGSPPAHPTVPFLIAAIVLVGWAYFLLAPGAWGIGRGVALGLAGACVGWVGRRRAPFGEGQG